MVGLWDVHCHIVPGVDDGSQSMKESLRMLQKMYEDGIRGVIATPHFRYDMFETSEKEITAAFRKLKSEAQKVLPELELYLDRELHASEDMVQRLRDGEKLSMADSRYVLLEFSTIDERSYIRLRTHQLLDAGYIPILAHVERYRAFREEPDLMKELKAAGAKMQVNAACISGRDGLFAKRFGKKMMKENLVDFVGTDGHNMDSRRPEMGKCVASMEKLMGAAYVRQILVENPGGIVKNIS